MTTTVTIPRAVDATALAALREGARGPVFTPDHPDYDTARSVYNAMIDRRPAVICRCADAADVIAAVRLARETGLPLSVRGGGHSAAGYAMNDGGVVVDLSAMRHVVVDRDRDCVLVGGGATLRDVDHATAPFGRAVPTGVVSTTGIAGLALGGGTGHLTRALGLTCDSLVAADVVTADGQVIKASEDSHPELFWALRGGGGNFGVVTNFEFRLHPVDTVLGGPLVYAGGAAAEVLDAYRRFMRETRKELGAFFAFHRAPPMPFIAEEHHGQPVCLVVVCWPGDIDEGREVISPLVELDSLVGSGTEPLPLATLNRANDDLVPPGLHCYWRGHFAEDISDELLEVHSRRGPTVPNISSGVHLYPIDGAAADVPPTATAFSHRDARYSTAVAALWDDPSESDENIRWVRDYWGELEDVAPRGGYVNFLSEDDGAAGVRATYRENYDRLAAVKLAYDPTNLFRMNQNIEPAAPGP